MKRHGLQFENKFGEWLEKNSQYSFKVPDTRTLRAKLRLINNTGTLNHYRKLITLQTPCDYISVTNGITTFWECKSTQLKSWPLTNIKQHQIDALFKSRKAGAESWVILNFHSPDMRIKGAYSMTYKLHPQVVVDFKFKYNRESIPLWYCEQNCERMIELCKEVN
jgi:penicillin-binding protein-related factor A (putative recombinase)